MKSKEDEKPLDNVVDELVDSMDADANPSSHGIQCWWVAWVDQLQHK